MKMPKKVVEEDDFDEEEEEFEEDEEDNKPIKFETRGGPKKVKKPEPKKEPSPAKQKRFAVFANPQRVGIVDAETQEVIAEGDYAILQVLADILERLESIENSVGSMLES
jgi:hypothetical protein